MQKWFTNDTLLFKIMRITAGQLLLLTLFTGVSLARVTSAQVLDKKVSVQMESVTLQEALTQLEKKAEVKFVYSASAMELTTKVSINATKEKLSEVLDRMLTPFSIHYVVKNNNYIVLKKAREKDTSEAGTQSESANLNPLKVSGTVTSSEGTPMPGVNVVLKGTNIGTSTDADGEYAIDAGETNILVFSFIGFKTFETNVLGQSVINVILEEDVTTLGTVVVNAGYYKTTELTKVGAISKVDAVDIQKQPVTNVLLALQGRVPGLVVTPTSGAPGATVRVQVRGQNTVGFLNEDSYNQPLILIDGLPFAPQNENINVLSSIGAGAIGSLSGFGALTNINPSDIESVTVLRDADATAIYGSRGAFGVILITTKKGTPGKTNFRVNVNTGPNKITRSPEFLNTQQYREIRREALRNENISLPPVYDGRYPELQLFDSTRYTNWFKEFFGQTSNNTDIHTSLTGGSENTNFILSTGYNRSSYNFPGDFADERFTLHSGFHYSSRDNKLSLDFGTDYSYGRNNSGMEPSAATAFYTAPNTPDLLDASGNLIWNYKGVDISQYQQYALLRRPYNLKKYNLNNTLLLSYRLFSGLNVSMNLGYSRFNTSEVSQLPLSTQSPSSFPTASASFGEKKFETINIEPQLNYTLSVGKGVFTALVGGTYKSDNNQTNIASGSGYANDGFLGSIVGARNVFITGNYEIYKYVGVYGRAGYVYDNRYILNITGRRDGSSNFGPGRQYGTFGSVGAGWIISEENMFETLKPIFSLTKLSVNYGTNGTDGVGSYLFQDFWTSSSNPFDPELQYYPANLYNPEYGWATKRQWNVSFDVGLFDRISFNATWYRNRTDNQLAFVPLPAQTGFSGVNDNMDATIQNMGWEFTLSSTNIKKGDFSWTTSFNLSMNRNKLLAFYDLEKSDYATATDYVVGESMSVVKGFLFKGVNETTGLFEFYDAEGNITSDPDYFADRKVIADLQPKFTGGLENTFSFKGLTLSVHFQFARQTALNFLAGIYAPHEPIGGRSNVPVQVLDRWQKPGDKARIQRLTSEFSSEAYFAEQDFMSSSGAYGDASYIRLKTLSLSYSLPPFFTKKAGLQNLRIYVNAQNLLTITKYEEGDPELPGQLAAIPMQRIIAYGLSFNF